MKTFDELFNEAKKTADRREKIFNRLIEKTKNEILPNFCEACRGYGMKHVFFKFWDIEILKDHYASFQDEFGETCYGISINVQDVNIEDCEVQQNIHTNTNTVHYIPRASSELPITEAVFTKKGILQFVKALNQRLAKYNQEYACINEEANGLIKS